MDMDQFYGWVSVTVQLIVLILFYFLLRPITFIFLTIVVLSRVFED